jgi:hypothetical protein
METAYIAPEETVELDALTSEEALVEEALASAALSAEDVDTILAEDDPLPMTTIDVEDDPDPADTDPAVDPPTGCEDGCGADPEDVGPSP